MQFEFHPLEQFCSLDTGVEGNASKRMNRFLWYRTVHYPKSSFIIYLILWRQGTSCLSFSLRVMYTVTINGENVCRVCVCVVVLAFALLLKQRSTASCERTKLKHRKNGLISFPLCSFFVSFCSSLLMENRNFGIQFSLWDFWEIRGLVSSPCGKEAACLPQ